MSKCNFDNSIEITLWHGCYPVNLLHIQARKKEKNSGGEPNSLQKHFGHRGCTRRNTFQLILSKTAKNTYFQGWVI